MRRHSSLTRISPTALAVANSQGVPTTVLANDQVQVEPEAVDELLQFLQTQAVLDGDLQRVVMTPDFHKGYGIPVGTVAAVRGAVLPKAIGNDIGCVDCETEFLSPSGWVRMDNYSGEQIMSYDLATGESFFEKPRRYIKQRCDWFYHLKTKYGVNQMLSPEHTVLYAVCSNTQLFNHYKTISAEELVRKHNNSIQGFRGRFLTTFIPRITTSMDLSDDELRVVVMLAADGSLPASGARTGRCELSFKNRRKISRAKKLLKAAGIKFKSTKVRGGVTNLYLWSTKIRSVLSPSKTISVLWQASATQLQAIVAELFHWDGNIKQHVYFTSKKDEADFASYAIAATGLRSVVRVDVRNDRHQPEYRVFAHKNIKVGINGSRRVPTSKKPSSDGYKYCFTTSTGYWVMRRGGNIAVTGNCGVQVIATTLHADDLNTLWPALSAKLRYIFFMGGRALALNPTQREAMLLAGPAGLNAVSAGGTSDLWAYYNRSAQLGAVPRFSGVHHANSAELFADFIKGSGGTSYDAQTGTVGGGNHFVEIQRVSHIFDHGIAYDLGLRKDCVVIMVHSGSVSLGHVVGQHFTDAAKQAWPRAVAHPKNGFYPLRDALLARYMNAQWNATNFAACNRLFLGLMAVRALVETTGRRFEHRMIYDAAHNVITQQPNEVYLHRKGACPATTGEPVFIPGSMGDHSYILQGLGSDASMHSACHGAGRALRRGRTKHAEIPSALRVVTPLDPDSLSVKSRPDIVKKYTAALAQEAPAAYKPVLPALDTVVAAEVALPLVGLSPLLTVKGH